MGCTNTVGAEIIQSFLHEGMIVRCPLTNPGIFQTSTPPPFRWRVFGILDVSVPHRPPNHRLAEEGKVLHHEGQSDSVSPSVGGT